MQLPFPFPPPFLAPLFSGSSIAKCASFPSLLSVVFVYVFMYVCVCHMCVKVVGCVYTALMSAV